MEYRNIGNSAIKASVITLGGLSIGGGSWWSDTDDTVSVETVHRALELGVNFIDTAPVYGLGHSETIIGRAIKGKRDKYVISTKATFDWDTGVGKLWRELDGHKVYMDHSYAGIIKDCENSLRRLQTDYIDVYYLHNPAKDVEQYPVSESARALNDLRQQGKIRTVGLSNIDSDQVEAYLSYNVDVQIVQRRYSIFSREAEGTLLPFCGRKGFSFHAYQPLERGILTGKVSKDYKLKPGELRSSSPLWSEERLGGAIDFAGSLRDIADKYGTSLLALALAYLRGNGEFVNVICGARKPPQIEEDAAAAATVLAPEDINEIRRRVKVFEAQQETLS
jgi:methylglyoxal reductase